MSFTTGLPVWTWPDWRKAKPGTRFRHNRSGATGTFIKPSKSRHNGAIVHWDNNPFGDADRESYVVAPARDLTPIEVA
jgi:hypothetical protein